MNHYNLQFCLHQIDRTKNFRLLRSTAPQVNRPADYSVEVGRGTEEEMIDLKREIMCGMRDEDGKNIDSRAGNLQNSVLLRQLQEKVKARDATRKMQ